MSNIQAPQKGRKVKPSVIGFLVAAFAVAGAVLAVNVVPTGASQTSLTTQGSGSNAQTVVDNTKVAPSLPTSTFADVQCTSNTLSLNSLNGRQTNSTDVSTPFKATTADAQFTEYSAELCGNPTLLKQTVGVLSGLSIGDGKTFADVSWVQQFNTLVATKDSNENSPGLNWFLKSTKDGKSVELTSDYQNYATWTRYALTAFKNLGVKSGLTSTSNWYVPDRFEVYGGAPALPIPQLDPQQENKPALVLGYTQKQGGCSYVIGFNTEDKRAETFNSSVCTLQEVPPQTSSTPKSTPNKPGTPGTPGKPGKTPHPTPSHSKTPHPTPSCTSNCGGTPPPTVCKPHGSHGVGSVWNQATCSYVCPSGWSGSPQTSCQQPKTGSPDPVNHGNAPTGGGKNDQPGPGHNEGSTPTLPAPPATPRQNPAPPAPSQSSGNSGGSSNGGSSGNTTTPSQPTTDPAPPPPRQTSAPAPSDPATGCAPAPGQTTC